MNVSFSAGKPVTLRLISLGTLLQRRESAASRKHFGLTELECRIVETTGANGPCSLKGLASLMLKDEGQLSRAVKKLTASGWLRRERSGLGPEIRIELTGEGRDLLEVIARRAAERELALISQFCPNDLEVLARLTDQMLAKAGGTGAADAQAAE